MIDPVALPGVQDKVSARMISVPVGYASNRYILKINPPEYPYVVENEAYFLGVARAMKMPVADAEVVRDADGRAGLLVRRYDRMPGPTAGRSLWPARTPASFSTAGPPTSTDGAVYQPAVGWRTPADWSWLSAARAAVGVTPYALAAISALRTGCAGSPERSCVQPSPFWVSPLARSVRREGGQPQVPAPWRSTWSQPGPGPCGATPNAPPVERAAPARDAGRTAVIDGGSRDLAARSQVPPPIPALDRWRAGGSSQHAPQSRQDQETTEFEFHISPVWNSSRPHTGVGTMAIGQGFLWRLRHPLSA